MVGFLPQEPLHPTRVRIVYQIFPPEAQRNEAVQSCKKQTLVDELG